MFKLAQALVDSFNKNKVLVGTFSKYCENFCDISLTHIASINKEKLAASGWCCWLVFWLAAVEPAPLSGDDGSQSLDTN